MEPSIRSVLLGQSFEEVGDTDLVLLAQHGIEEAYVELCRRHRTMAYRIVSRITKNHEDSEDVVQESILKAYLHIRSFDGRSRFSTWLTRIAINTALMARRRARVRAAESLDDASYDGQSLMDSLEYHSPSPEALVVEMDQHAQMLRTIEGLPPNLRGVLELRLDGNTSVREAADAMGISLAAAKSRLMRAQREVISRMRAHSIR